MVYLRKNTDWKTEKTAKNGVGIDTLSINYESLKYPPGGLTTGRKLWYTFQIKLQG